MSDYENVLEIDGRKIKFNEDARMGIKYLQLDLNNDEVDVFFHEAKRRGSAQFESDFGGKERQFTLEYHSDGTYSLERRH